MDGNTKQRYISTSIWTDEWFDSLSGKEKLIYFNLLSNPHTNAAGVYPLLLKQICADTGYSREDVNAAMQRFEEDGKAFYHRGYIIIPKHMKHQKLSERSKMFVGAIKILRGLPTEIKAFISDRSHYDFDVGKYVNMSADGPSEQEGVAYAPNDDSLSIGYGEPMPNSPHDSDLDLDLDSDLDSKNSAAPSEPPSPQNDSQKNPKRRESPDPSPIETSADSGQTLIPKNKKPSLREREPENDQERVVKAYLENWDSLRRQGIVKTVDPVLNFAQIGSLIKGLRKNQGLDIGRIISVVNKSANDAFVLQNGFSLGGILSASNVNKQLNGSTGPPSGYGHGNSPPPSLAGKKSLGALLRSSGEGGHSMRDDLDESHGEGGFA